MNQFQAYRLGITVDDFVDIEDRWEHIYEDLIEEVLSPKSWASHFGIDIEDVADLEFWDPIGTQYGAPPPRPDWLETYDGVKGPKDDDGWFKLNPRLRKYQEEESAES